MPEISLLKLGFRRQKKDIRQLFVAKPEPSVQSHDVKLPTDRTDREDAPFKPRFVKEFFDTFHNFGNMNELHEIAGNMPFER
jgi:hypothetical protein